MNENLIYLKMKMKNVKEKNQLSLGLLFSYQL